MLAGEAANRVSQRWISRAIVRHQRQPADLHHEVSSERRNALGMVQVIHARHGRRMGGMQMNDGPCARPWTDAVEPEKGARVEQ